MQIRSPAPVAGGLRRVVAVPLPHDLEYPIRRHLACQIGAGTGAPPAEVGIGVVKRDA